MTRDWTLRRWLALWLFVLSTTAAAHAEYPVLHRETARRSFEPAAGRTTRLVVDNVFGRIRVRGHETNRIDLEFETTIRGRSRDDLERARREVSLEVTEEPGLVELYVDGPFRHPSKREWSRIWGDRGYKVIYDFELVVPRRIDLDIRTVDGGHVRVAGIDGRFEVRNVNGGIEMSAIGGSGTVETVNGPVRVAFDANPAADSRFVTVNGDVEIRFRRGLSADLDLQTTFGELWTQFEVRPLASRPARESVDNGRRVIRSDSGARVRVAAGGPTHYFETLNGDVLIRLVDGDAVLEELQ